LGKWLTYYYKAWFEKDPICILREFDDFRLSNIIIYTSNLMGIFGDIGVL